MTNRKKRPYSERLEERLMQNPEYVQHYAEMKPYDDVAMQIIQFRNEKGWTQTQLAEAVGTTQQQISKIESFDYTGMRLETIRRIAAALGKELKVELV